jgi:aspartate carbamoyltransferase catalytic subunit
MSGLLGLEGATRDEILGYLELADRFLTPAGELETPPEYRTALENQPVSLLFFEPSTRTRASFELAIHRLGGYPMIFDSEESSIRKGETELDTCANLVAMGVRAFVIRHSERRVPLRIADRIGVPVINAGNGSGEHPSQALLDAYTLRQAFERTDSLEGIRVAIIGDIVHSRVARSDVYALRALGASVVVAGPAPLLPTARDEWDVDFAEARAEALDGADAVIALRVQRERMHRDAVEPNEYVRQWGIDRLVVETEMSKNAFVLHPGPVIRGVELSSDVADGKNSLILRQARNGVAVRQAILCRHLCGDDLL